MFEWLKKYNRIFVTGPHRSGTRICAKMIAHDTRYAYIDEKDFHIDSFYMLYSILEKKEPYVIQCPVLCRYIHIFSAKNTAIILMRRKVGDILSSQKRIGWSWEWLELIRYDRSDGNIAEIKYQFWDKEQKEKIQNAFEIDYESLREHPLWIPRNLRSEFDADQTSSHNIDFVLNSNICLSPTVGIFVCKDSKDDSVILVKSKQRAKRLNETGQFIWNLCNGEQTYRDIFQKLKKNFSKVREERLAQDMVEFINELVNDNFLRLSLKTDSISGNQMELKNKLSKK